MPGPCPTLEHLAAALRGQSGDSDAELAAHLANCPACRAQLETLAGGSGWLEAKARAHGSTTSESLRQAILALESRPDAESESPSPPKLDFLQPSQVGVLGRFGPYEVIAHVASGGMGIVLKARDPALDRIVALKILPPTLAANALARARFVREARAAAAVVHEHVVPIYAVDECAGLPYIVMQFVQGRPLSERIRATGALRLEEILRIGAQTAAGLAAAHAQGLIHRDVKPGNILLENSVERVKLTDFGLARAVDDTGLTRTGELAGTPEFMSPEQAGGGTIDHRTDLFSLGSVLYAMSTGRSPFHATSAIAAVRKVCDEHPRPVHEVNPAMPRWLSDLIAKLMAKSPAERFQSAREVGDLLERYLARVQRGELGEIPGVSTRPAATARTRRRIAISAIAAFAVAAVLFLAFRDPRGASSGFSPSTSLQQRRELTPSPSSSLQDSFVVRTAAGASLGRFPRIEDALAAAPSNGVVELRWNGLREMPPVTLPARPLILRAGEGFQPLWIHTNPLMSALSASAALTVEDIELSLRPKTGPAPGGARMRRAFGPSGIGLIAMSDARLRLSRCVLQLPDPRTEPRGNALAGAHPSAIVLNNVATCELENSALLGIPLTAVLWRQTADRNATVADEGREGRLSLSNCIVTAFHAFWIESPKNSRTRLQMVRNTFGGKHLLFSAAGAAGAISVFAQTNLFSTATIVVDGRTTNREVFTASMRWQGSDNLFSLSNSDSGRPWGYIVLRNTAGPTTLAQWNQWWPEPETGSREVNVTFAGFANAASSDSGADFARAAYKVTKLDVIDEGPPLTPDQWSRFGADIANVGPRSAK